MPRICLLLIAGLDKALLNRSQHLPLLGSFPHHAPYQPPFPAVTSTTQATLTTGFDPLDHGIICNGLYTHRQPDLLPLLDLSNHAESRQNVSFWEQSNALLQKPHFWHAPAFTNKKVAMLFWQNAIGSADIVLTPKPTHTPDGKTLTACFSTPPSLYPDLTAKLGPFPPHNHWSPMASLPSSQWIAKAAEHVWDHHTPDLQLVYIPHLDYNLQRLGPDHPAILKDLADIDALLAPLAAKIRAAGDILILAGDYGMTPTTHAILPNLALRKAGLLATTPDPQGKLLVDYANSQAFVMADHQAAFLYTQSPAITSAAISVLMQLEGVDMAELPRPGEPANPRAGAAVLHAKPTAWFAHDWWESDAEKPAWQFSVDIHNKPGYDPRELFFDPQKKCIAQDPALVKASHGLIHDPVHFPVLLSDTPLPPDFLIANQVAPWLASLLAS